MSKLVYCAYNLIDQDDIPDWAKKLPENPLVQRESWAIYNPIKGFTGNLEGNLTMPALLSSRLPPERVRKGFQSMRLDPILLEPLSVALPRLKAADEGPTSDVALKSLYVLMRADIVLVDLNQPGHGESSQEVVYAYLCGVPVVGVAHRFILSPWMINKLSAVIFPRTTDEIVQQVLAHDHKTTTMLDHYRAERLAAEQQAAREKARAERISNRNSRILATKRNQEEPVTGKPQASDDSSDATEEPTQKPKTTKKRKRKGKEVADGKQSGSGPV